jgi:23S rRNA pseudouridine2605 synthase
MRLQRLLASAGFGSRRQCEELIESGRVDVDGEIVTQLGTTVDPAADKVRVDGVPLKKQKLVYYAVNKPVGFVTTNRDPHGRPRVIDLVPPDERVFPVGRLDRSSEGLILLTNDGELAQKLTHPKFGVRKVYRVTVAGKVDGETMKKMRQGIYIAEGFVKVEGVKLLKSRSRATELEVVLREGKNREIRRILARLGHKVQQLRRIAVGPLRLGDVPSGAYRVVTPLEVEKLWGAAESSSEPDHRARRTRPRGGKKSPTKGGTSSGRRPAKKSPRGDRTGRKELPFSLGETKTTGIVIGEEPASTEQRPKKPGRKAKKGAVPRTGRSRNTATSKKRRASAEDVSSKGSGSRGGGRSTHGSRRKPTNVRARGGATKKGRRS